MSLQEALAYHSGFRPQRTVSREGKHLTRKTKGNLTRSASPSSSPRATKCPSSTSCQLLQIGQRTVEDVAITTISVAIRILPDSLVRPTARNSSRSSRAIPRQNERASRVEGGAVACTSSPPIIGAVDHRIPGGFAMVGVDKVLDPTDHGGL